VLTTNVAAWWTRFGANHPLTQAAERELGRLDQALMTARPQAPGDAAVGRLARTVEVPRMMRILRRSRKVA
jgi:hypothetical protein